MRKYINNYLIEHLSPAPSPTQYIRLYTNDSVLLNKNGYVTLYLEVNVNNSIIIENNPNIILNIKDSTNKVYSNFYKSKIPNVYIFDMLIDPSFVGFRNFYARLEYSTFKLDSTYLGKIYPFTIQYGSVSYYVLNTDGTYICNLNTNVTNNGTIGNTNTYDDVLLYGYPNIYNITNQIPVSNNQRLLLSIDNKFIFSVSPRLDYKLLKVVYNNIVPDHVLFDQVDYYATYIGNILYNILTDFGLNYIEKVDISEYIRLSQTKVHGNTIPMIIIHPEIIQNIWIYIVQDKICANILLYLNRSDLDLFINRLKYLIAFNAIKLNFLFIQYTPIPFTSNIIKYTPTSSKQLTNTPSNNTPSNNVIYTQISSSSYSRLQWNITSLYYLNNTLNEPDDFCYNYSSPSASSNVKLISNSCNSKVFGNPLSGLQTLNYKLINNLSNFIYNSNSNIPNNKKLDTFFTYINDSVTNQLTSNVISITDNNIINNINSHYSNINPLFDIKKPIILLSTMINPITGNQKVDISNVSIYSNTLISLDYNTKIDVSDGILISRKVLDTSTTDAISKILSNSPGNSDALEMYDSIKSEYYTIQQNQTFTIDNKEYKFICAGSPIVLNRINDVSPNIWMPPKNPSYTHDSDIKESDNSYMFIGGIALLLTVGILGYFGYHYLYKTHSNHRSNHHSNHRSNHNSNHHSNHNSNNRGGYYYNVDLNI